MKKWERDYFRQIAVNNKNSILNSLIKQNNQSNYNFVKNLKEQSQQAYLDAMEWERLKKEHKNDNKEQDSQEVELKLNGKKIKGSLEDAIIEEINKTFK